MIDDDRTRTIFHLPGNLMRDFLPISLNLQSPDENACINDRSHRREFLWQMGGGLGGIALNNLLANDVATDSKSLAIPAGTEGTAGVLSAVHYLSLIHI